MRRRADNCVLPFGSMAVIKENAIEDHVQQEAQGRRSEQRPRGAVITADFHRFRKQLEKGDANNGAGTEAKHQVAFVLEPKREQSAAKSCTKRREGNQEEARGHVFLLPATPPVVQQPKLGREAVMSSGVPATSFIRDMQALPPVRGTSRGFSRRL